MIYPCFFIINVVIIEKTRKGMRHLKSTGVIIEIDDNGGITLPIEVLEETGIEYNDSLKMISKGENIHLVKEE